MASYVFSGTKLVFVTADGKQYTVEKSNPRFPHVAKAITENRSDDDIVAALGNFGSVKDYVAKHSNVEYKSGVVYVNGKALHNTVASRVALFAQNGLPIEPLLKFIGNLEDNPSYNSREELYQFLEQMDIVLTEDGCFLAYKSVRSDYYDKYSGTILNTVGSVVEMNRSQIDDNCNNHCSKGLHVGGLKYSGKGGWYNSPSDRVMIVKVNPRDAVSVPSDHSYQKLRVCKYEVVCESDQKLEHPLYKACGDSYEYEPVPYEDADFDGFDEYEEYDNFDEGDIYDDEYDYDDEDYEDDDDSDFLNLPPEIKF